MAGGVCAFFDRQLLSTAPGVKVVDTPADKQYPMPLTATQQYDVEVRGKAVALLFSLP